MRAGVPGPGAAHVRRLVHGRRLLPGRRPAPAAAALRRHLTVFRIDEPGADDFLDDDGGDAGDVVACTATGRPAALRRDPPRRVLLLARPVAGVVIAGDECPQRAWRCRRDEGGAQACSLTRGSSICCTASARKLAIVMSSTPSITSAISTGTSPLSEAAWIVRKNPGMPKPYSMTATLISSVETFTPVMAAIP